MFDLLILIALIFSLLALIIAGVNILKAIALWYDNRSFR